MLSDKQIKDAVFAVLRKWKDDRAWDRYTREVGPYDIGELRPEVLEIIKAVLTAADGVEGRDQQPSSREPLMNPPKEN